MISKYRNQAALQISCALGLTLLLTYLLCRTHEPNPDGFFAAVMVFAVLGNWALWIYGSYTLAKAKGYGSDMAGGIFVALCLLALCLPVSVLIYPAVVLFGLKDKARDRRSRH